MLELIVIDSSAENRQRLMEQIALFLKPGNPDLEYLPRMSIKPLTPQEIKFHAAPDICIVGANLLTVDCTELGRIKKLLPDVRFIVELSPALESLAVVEQLVRYGADDFLPIGIAANDFIRKLVVLSRRGNSARSGKLILVDGGKGGVGVTTVAATLSEALYDEGKSVVLIDLDFDTQDLSRFLQARPFINENLQSILSGNRPATQEFVEDCLTSVWEGEDTFKVLSPIPNSDALFDSRNSIVRTFIAVLEILDSSYDCIVVDMGNVRGGLLRALYRAADMVFFIVNNDAATVYASLDRLQRVRSLLTPEASLVIQENGMQRPGLPSIVLQREFIRAAQLPSGVWNENIIPFCSAGSKWPGSAGTLYSRGSRSVQQAVVLTLAKVGLIDAQASVRTRERIARWLRLLANIQRLRSTKRKDTPLPRLGSASLRRALPDPFTARTEEKEFFPEELVNRNSLEQRGLYSAPVIN